MILDNRKNMTPLEKAADALRRHVGRDWIFLSWNECSKITHEKWLHSAQIVIEAYEKAKNDP